MPAAQPSVWLMYLSGGVALAAGLLTAWKDVRDAPPGDKLVVLGPLFFAIPLAVFGAQHFVQTGPIMGLMPSWIPAHLFFVLLVGACLIAGG